MVTKKGSKGASGRLPTAKAHKREGGAARRVLTGDGGDPSPFANSPLGSEARACGKASELIGAVYRLALFLGGEICCIHHADMALADFYYLAVEWITGMQHDQVDVGLFLTRLRKAQVESLADDACVTPTMN